MKKKVKEVVKEFVSMIDKYFNCGEDLESVFMNENNAENDVMKYCLHFFASELEKCEDLYLEENKDVLEFIMYMKYIDLVTKRHMGPKS